MIRFLASILVGVLLSTPCELVAQERPLEVEMRAGYGVPLGELTDFLESGPALWLGARYWLTDRIAVRGEIGQTFLFGKEVERRSLRLPPEHRFEVDTRMRRVLGGVDVEITPVDGSRLRPSVRLCRPAGPPIGTTLTRRL